MKSKPESQNSCSPPAMPPSAAMSLHVAPEEAGLNVLESQPSNAHIAQIAATNIKPQEEPISSSQVSIDDSFFSTQYIVVFVNPTSGGNAAASFMELGISELRLACPERVHLWVFDIREGTSGNKVAFLKLKALVEDLKKELCSKDVDSTNGGAIKNPSIYVIAAGGDGTVMWMVSQIWAHGIDDSYVAIGVVPYGTGNDFARTFGWQKFNAAKPFEAKFRGLRRLIQGWLSARIVWHDIWDVSVQSYPDGSFQKIDPASRLKRLATGVHLVRSSSQTTETCRRLTFKMCNYFSMGVESRIGIGFERYRTRNLFCNKLRYGVEGAKKAFFKRPLRLDTMLQSLVVQPDNSTDVETVFSHAEGSKKRLQAAGSIIATNIPSFAAGMDIWNAARRWGLTTPTDKQLMSQPQRLGDGVLEFTAFKGVLDMGLERAIRGHGMRVAQGNGPFRMTFKPTNPAPKAPENRMYFQVDGEFFIVTRPQNVTLKWCRRIRVLASLTGAPSTAEYMEAKTPTP